MLYNLVLYIDGPAYVHEYQTLLQSVTFDIMVDEPELTPRELCFTIFDGLHTSSPTCVVIEIIPVNDHNPELNLTSSNPLFVEQTTEGVVLLEDITITDEDHLDIFPLQHVSVSFWELFHGLQVFPSSLPFSFLLPIFYFLFLTFLLLFMSFHLLLSYIFSCDICSILTCLSV